MLSRIAALCLCVATTAAVSAFAQQEAPCLKWDRTTVVIESDGGTATQSASFHFRNTGSLPVAVRSATTSCGCTVTKADKTAIAPGESGELRVTHKPKPGAGVRNYRINVETDESGRRLYELILQVNNTPRVVVEPRVVTWEQGEARKSKSVAVRLRKNDSLKLTGAQADKDMFDIRIADGPAADTQMIVVTPKTGASPGRVRVGLLTDPPLPRSMDTQFFAVLR